MFLAVRVLYLLVFAYLQTDVPDTVRAHR